MVAIEEKPTEKLVAGILIVKTDQDPTAESAKVIGVDPAVLSVKEGDTILFKSYSLSEISLGGKKYGFLKEDEVIAIQEND